MSVISSRRAWRQPQAALSAACLSMVVALAIGLDRLVIAYR